MANSLTKTSYLEMLSSVYFRAKDCDIHDVFRISCKTLLKFL